MENYVETICPRKKEHEDDIGDEDGNVRSCITQASNKIHPDQNGNQKQQEKQFDLNKKTKLPKKIVVTLNRRRKCNEKYMWTKMESESIFYNITHFVIESKSVEQNNIG